MRILRTNVASVRPLRLAAESVAFVLSKQLGSKEGHAEDAARKHEFALR